MDSSREPLVAAVCGKGGVGKTSVSAMLIKTLAGNPEKKVLAIDADPAVGLSIALGISPAKTLEDVRNSVIDGVKMKKGASKEVLSGQIDYEILEALEERGNLAFLAIGRPEDEGCYCRLNAFLRAMIEKLAGGFDYVIIDGEAGIEQVNRRVMETLTHLLLVTDASLKGHRVAGLIAGAARRLAASGQTGLVFNAVRPADDISGFPPIPGVPVSGIIPEDEEIRRFDAAGSSFLELPACPALQKAAEIAAGLDPV